eukprot:204078-Prymnesium_polylepis.1
MGAARAGGGQRHQRRVAGRPVLAALHVHAALDQRDEPGAADGRAEASRGGSGAPDAAAHSARRQRRAHLQPVARRHASGAAPASPATAVDPTAVDPTSLATQPLVRAHAAQPLVCRDAAQPLPRRLARGRPRIAIRVRTATAAEPPSAEPVDGVASAAAALGPAAARARRQPRPRVAEAGGRLAQGLWVRRRPRPVAQHESSREP